MASPVSCTYCGRAEHSRFEVCPRLHAEKIREKEIYDKAVNEGLSGNKEAPAPVRKASDREMLLIAYGAIAGVNDSRFGLVKDLLSAHIFEKVNARA